MKTLLAACAAAALLSATAAMAQTSRQQAQEMPRQERSPAAMCEKMCPYDNSPCDPLNFKLADGRCQNSTRGD